MDSALFTQQYALVQSARAALLDYCAALPPAHLTAPLPAFNDSCLRDLLVHVAGAYHYWLGHVALQQFAPLPQPADYSDIAAIRRLYAAVDNLVVEFVEHTGAQWLTETSYPLPRHQRTLSLTPLQLFTHATTHEFHHKGQLLTMSRLLGHVPVDTDVIRF